ncbi:unnamed protein product [Phytophthora lilii]|uniref:Unnamed protein product n=1 Tax=Phytophthora lilii TaxID=2077276 RepID=A0A9W6WY64_9STRA|nr:unnamed protein product [Phytophthora lilii]
MLEQLALIALVFQAVTIPRAAGHGNIVTPKLTGVGPTALKDFIIAECGNTAKTGTPQPVPSDGFAVHDTLGSSHPGPCEIWCDNTRVFSDSNCAEKFKGQVPTKIPIDVSVCQSSSTFVFYWLALHAQPWQVYINCAPLGGSGGAATPATGAATPATGETTPATGATTPATGETTPATKAPSTGATPSAPSTPSTPSTQAPTTGGNTPTVTQAAADTVGGEATGTETPGVATPYLTPPPKCNRRN